MECGVVCSLLWLSLQNTNILQDPECVISAAESSRTHLDQEEQRDYDVTVNELNLYKTYFKTQLPLKHLNNYLNIIVLEL